MAIVVTPKGDAPGRAGRRRLDAREGRAIVVVRFTVAVGAADTYATGGMDIASIFTEFAGGGAGNPDIFMQAGPINGLVPEFDYTNKKMKLMVSAAAASALQELANASAAIQNLTFRGIAWGVPA